MIDSNFYMGGMLDFADDIDILNCNNIYDSTFCQNVHFSYDYSDLRLKKLSQILNLNVTIVKDDDFSRLLQITFWLACKLNLGAATDTSSFHTLEVFEKTKNKFVSNCFIAATVLTECFLSLGYKARMVRCMPIDLRFTDCHCMTIVEIEKFQKFVVFDAAMGGCYMDLNGMPMGICEIKNALIQGDDFKIRSIFQIDQRWIKQYLAKNMIRFQSHKISRYGNEINDRPAVLINLNPLSLPISNKEYTIGNRTIEELFIYNSEQFWS